jgi:TRAP-type C4-dicarboxylate transport system substrate-binding protein
MRVPVSLLLVALLLSGCRAGGDKAGGRQASKGVVLTLAIGADSTEVSGFAGEVNRFSGGALRIRVVPNWRYGQSAYEQALVSDVRSGKADLGAVGARVWDTFGVRGFRALVAPFLIDSYTLQNRVLRGPISGELLADLRPLGLAGLALLPGPLRRPAGAERPLLSPSNYARLRIGVQPSSVANATIRTLGAVPVAYPSNIPAKGVGGVESHITAIQNTHEDLYVRYLTTNVVLWPRPLVVFGTKRTLARLTPAARSALQRAAADDVSRETAYLIAYERSATANECVLRRLRFVSASAGQRTALRDAVAPVYTRLERDPRTRRLIAEIAMVSTRVGAATSSVPRCRGIIAGRSTKATTILDGAYSSTVRPADLPPPERVGEQDGTWQIVLDRGQFRLSERSRTADWVANGDAAIVGDTMTWHFANVEDWGPHGAPDGVPASIGDEVAFRWRKHHGKLTLTALATTALPGLVSQPLTRSGDAPGQEPLQNAAPLQGVWLSNATAADVISHHDDAGGIADNTGPCTLLSTGADAAGRKTPPTASTGELAPAGSPATLSSSTRRAPTKEARPSRSICTGACTTTAFRSRKRPARLRTPGPTTLGAKSADWLAP